MGVQVHVTGSWPLQPGCRGVADRSLAPGPSSSGGGSRRNGDTYLYDALDGSRNEQKSLGQTMHSGRGKGTEGDVGPLCCSALNATHTATPMSCRPAVVGELVVSQHPRMLPHGTSLPLLPSAQLPAIAPEPHSPSPAQCPTLYSGPNPTHPTAAQCMAPYQYRGRRLNYPTTGLPLYAR